MTKRKTISKGTRFEVFKRDSFTCQYCGAKAPEVVLHCDHINPVANGGDNAIMNLVTACADCNGGKGARKLDDRSTVERQRAQVEELQARREQLEMMLKWRDAEQATAIDVVEAICERMGERGGFLPNESGKQSIRRWLKRFSVGEILEALDESFDSYMEFDGDEPNKEAWEKAFKKLPAIASLRRQAVERPYVVKLAYVQAILRRRFRDPRGNYFPALEDMIVDYAIGAEVLEAYAKSCSDWNDFCCLVSSWWANRQKLAGTPPVAPTEPDEASERAKALAEEEAEELRRIDAAYDDDGYDRDGFDD